MVKPIYNEEDYKNALTQVEKLWGSQQYTNEGDELDVLLVLIQVYEDQHYSMPPSDPVEAIQFLMDQKNLTRKDLEIYLGPKSRVGDILNRKRHLTMRQIINLHNGLHIPYECLINGSVPV